MGRCGVACVCCPQIVAPEDTIKAIEEHKEMPHDIADSTFIFTHKRFSFAYNGDQVCCQAACDWLVCLNTLAYMYTR